jgi:integrase/recombinase XerC
MRAAHLSPLTIKLRREHLGRLARAHLADKPWSMEPDELVDWLGSHNWGRETARTVRTSLRRFWHWGLMSGRTTIDVAAGLPSIPPAPLNRRPAEPRAVVRTLANASDRVRLMVRLANELGLRRGEVAVVHPELDLVRNATGWSLVVHGKGQRNRVLPLPADLAMELRSAPAGYLFPGGVDGHLSANRVGVLVSQALGEGTTMHQLRHLCATEIHEQTKDIRLVQTVLGHASLATTQRYVAVDDSKMRAAIAERSGRWQRG